MVVVIPPPVNGMTMVSQAVARQVGARARVWPVRNLASHRGLVWTLVKHAKLSFALLRAALAGGGRGSLYFVPDAQMGLLLNLIEAPLMRLGFSKIILHHHVFSYSHHRDWRMALWLKILGPKAHHIVLGQSMRARIEALYGSSSVHVLGNAAFIDAPDRAAPRSALKRLGFLGNITREKGIELVLATASLALAQSPELTLDIAGPIQDPDLRAEVEAFCAQDPARRLWRGSVQGAEKAEFLASIDVLLFPTLYANEALPLTIYEALSNASPALAIGRGCIPDQLAGSDWVLPEAEFAPNAAQILAGWAADPAQFRAASARALALFDRHLQEDRAMVATLEALI